MQSGSSLSRCCHVGDGERTAGEHSDVYNTDNKAMLPKARHARLRPCQNEPGFCGKRLVFRAGFGRVFELYSHSSAVRIL